MYRKRLNNGYPSKFLIFAAKRQMAFRKFVKKKFKTHLLIYRRMDDWYFLNSTSFSPFVECDKAIFYEASSIFCLGVKSKVFLIVISKDHKLL